VKTNVHFLSYCPHFILEWEMFQAKVVEEIKTHVLCSLTLFFLKNHAVLEIMYKDTVERNGPQTTIWRVRIACWIPKATITDWVYLIFIVCPLQKWLHERASVLRCMHIACLVMYSFRNLSYSSWRLCSMYYKQYTHIGLWAMCARRRTLRGLFLHSTQWLGSAFVVLNGFVS
jgi:hypothetical protein